VNWIRNAERLRPVALATAILFVCLPVHRARGQHHAAAPSRPQFSAPRQAPQPQSHPQRQAQQREYQNQRPGYPFQPQSNGAVRETPNYPANVRPGAQTPYGNPGYQGTARPAYPGAAPRGHLGDWLNQHRNVPVQQQEQILRSNPNFNRLPPETQQRMVQQLHNLNQMSEPQRERTLARGEMLERMSPQQQMQVRQAGRRLTALPPERQIMVKRAFQDLSHVPLDQRDTVLNSARYQNNFSPDERDILGNLLRAEPYEPPHQ
jgi:hypothetical protein